VASPGVTTYRLYFLDYAGHIHEARSFDCADDESAARTAAGQDDRRSMELWTGGRLVRAFQHAPEDDPAHA
jgi:hypothetical protein